MMRPVVRAWLRLSRRALLALVVGTVPGAAQQPPPPVYVDEGACPFECCRYGDWIAAAEAPLHASPDSLAPEVGRVAAGEAVEALTGEVRVVPAPFLVKDTLRGPEGQRWVAGDTIWVLTYIGEGFFRIWEDGEVQRAELDFGPYGSGMGTRCEWCAHGVLLRPYRHEWWIRVRRGDGSVGWTNRPDHFDGKDACSVVGRDRPDRRRARNPLVIRDVDSIPESRPLSVLLEGPVSTPYTVAPEVLNRDEVGRARLREYADTLRDTGVAGSARVFFLLDSDGEVLKRVLDESSGHPELDAAALRVSEVFRFSPAKRGDTRVPVWISIPIRFGPERA